MSNRLTKIYTRTGDKGETGLTGGERIAKDNALVHAMGDIDELNSLLGLLACKVQGEIAADIKTIQNDLFDVGGELSSSHALIKKESVSWLENKLDALNDELSPLKELPGTIPPCSKAGGFVLATFISCAAPVAATSATCGQYAHGGNSAARAIPTAVLMTACAAPNTLLLARLSLPAASKAAAN